MNELEIFTAALEQEVNHRAKFLGAACGADTELRRRIDDLLLRHEQAGAFFEKPAAEILVTAEVSLAAERPGTQIGRYKLLEQVGEGGMGVVYVAEQTEPVRRRVALKIIKPGMDTKQVIARFEAERQALAMMDHPNIARVLDAGTTDAGRPYFVMELVRGMPITEYCDKVKLPPRQRLELFVDVCQAVQHAHQKGIIHRDLKPSNVMVTTNDGRPVVKVIDFGVAKAVGQQLTERTVYTALTQLVGTPLYMSPEQAELTSNDVDTRSDVYSLGVLLYELLTGQTPFDKEALSKAGFDEMRRIIREDEPLRPSRRFSTLGVQAISTASQHRGVDERRLSRILCGELDWIVMKALEKDRSRRYESASALAADIQRYLSDEPVLACPPTTMYRFQKFARKHKPVFATAAAIAGCLILGTTVSAWQAARATTAEAQANANEKKAVANEQKAEEKAHEATTQRDEAQRQRDEVKALNEKLQRAQAEQRTTLYAAHMILAQRAWDSSNPERVAELLDQHRPKPGQTDVRGFEWHYLNRLAHSELLTLKGHTRPADSVAYSPDGKRIASASRGVRDPVKKIRIGGELKVWDAQTGKAVLTIEEDCGTVRFSPDGKRLAASMRGGVKLLDAESGKELLSVDGYGPIAFSSDGKRLATGGDLTEGDKWQPLIKLWDAQTGQRLNTPSGYSMEAEDLALSPDGQLLAGTTSWEDTVKIWNTETGQVVHTLTGSAWTLAFSPDGKMLAAAGMEVKLWDPVTGKEIRSIANQSAISVAFSPDGKRLVSSGRGALQVWDIQTAKEIRTLNGRFGKLAFSPDGTRVASSSDDNLVRVWDVQNDQDCRLLDPLGARGFDISADWSRYVRSTPDKRITVRDVQSGKEVAPIKGHGVPARVVAISPNGRLAASGAGGPDSSSVSFTDQAIVKIWDVTTGQELFSLQGSSGNVFWLAFSPDGKRLACISQAPPNPASLQVWDTATGKELANIRADQGPRSVAVFSPDGSHLASCARGAVKISDAHTGAEIRTLPAGDVGARMGLAYSPDGKKLACGGNQKIVVLDAETGREVAVLKGVTGGVFTIIFSPDGKRLVSLAGDGKAKLWDVESAQELLTLEGGGRRGFVAFSPDGYRLALSGNRGAVKIYDATPLPEQP